MPRPIDTEGKSNRLVLAPRVDQEIKVKAFRELCARNGLSISDELFKRVEEFLKEHNWPPGNSQTLLRPFLPGGGEDPKPLQCSFCKGSAVGYAVYQGKLRRPVCTSHKEELGQHTKWVVEP